MLLCGQLGQVGKWSTSSLELAKFLMVMIVSVYTSSCRFPLAPSRAQNSDSTEMQSLWVVEMDNEGKTDHSN